jgi:N-acetylmuramoyl-L-alanine amidase
MSSYQARSRVVLLLLVVTVIAAIIALTGHETQAQNPPTLYWGSSGRWVREVQFRLRNWGYYDGPVDSYYGGSTWNAVKVFQRRNGLAVDGVVGPQTYRALGIWVPSQRTASTAAAGSAASPRSNDVDLLARLILGEAEGEPYEGQVAVAAVILSRVRSPSFPNTISGVVYQPLAFESVSTGRIYRAPRAQHIRAAQDALNGWDPTYGSLYFWAYKKPVNPWVWSRQIVRYIGNHVFAR